MKVNRCEALNFYGKNDFPVEKPRYVTQKIKSDAKILLDKMNSGTKYKMNEDGTGFTSNILARIMLDDKTAFVDERNLIVSTNVPDKYTGTCSLTMGKTKLRINISTGEIINHKKSIFKTWKSVYSQAEQCLQDFIVKFDDSEAVKKKFFGIAGLTKKGLDLLNKKIYGFV